MTAVIHRLQKLNPNAIYHPRLPPYNPPPDYGALNIKRWIYPHYAQLSEQQPMSLFPANICGSICN